MMDFLDVKRDDLNYAHLYKDNTKLMINAARQLSDFVRKTYGSGIRIVAICGTGNNAGDGIVALEQLRKDNDVTVLLVKGRRSLKTAEARWAIKNYGGRTLSIRSLEKTLGESDVVLDCLFGIGISGEPREPYAKTIDLINKMGKNVVSVDVPSGLGAGKAVHPVHTVTFTDVKNGMNEGNSGKIHVRDIGIPDDVRNYAGPGDMVYFKKPGEDSHKGMNGTLSILGGWEFHGSSVIGAQGANAFGTDLVRIYTTSHNYQIISSYSPYIIVRNIEHMETSWVEECSANNAVLIGPGMGVSERAAMAMREVAERTRGQLVIDADGIKMSRPLLNLLYGRKVIFTPHSREFQILTGMEASRDNAISFAKEHSAIIVLKGEVDTITDGVKVMQVRGGNARMTMGGTGDLLAGLIAAAASRKIDPFRAAIMGAYANKKIAELSYKQKSYWYSIDDMISNIPSFMMENVQWAMTDA